jgi:hypothetical protein
MYLYFEAVNVTLLVAATGIKLRLNGHVGQFQINWIFDTAW